jgi:hypothetical protein
LGLELAKGKKIKVLKVVGNLNSIVQQVRNHCAAKTDRMKKCRNAEWDSIELFDAFSIKAVRRDENECVDVLAVGGRCSNPSAL